jgi:Zn finger protein HypA/HybF involved in hydrogenase expression
VATLIYRSTLSDNTVQDKLRSAALSGVFMKVNLFVQAVSLAGWWAVCTTSCTLERQERSCPNCPRTISPDDTIVFNRRLLGHLDCRRPRVLSAEERSLLFIYCRDHQVAECIRCTRGFHLREVASLDSFGVRTHGCPRCHTAGTDPQRDQAPREADHTCASVVGPEVRVGTARRVARFPS